MKKTLNRITCIVLILVVIISLFVFSLLAGISQIFIGSRGRNNQGGNSGSAVNRFLEIAESELGTVGGDKYRRWYTGRADGQPWCATFISWCANEAGILDTCIPKFQGCSVGVSWFKSHDQWIPGNTYVPNPGDIIFFEFQNPNDGPEHVGIVWKVEDGMVTTIEGNSSDQCQSNNYSLSYSAIYGYGTPVYPENTSQGTMEFSNDDIYYLAQLVYAEAGSSWLTDHHQQMVASVVINRINSPLYPNTLREVIAQPGQYQPYIDGSLTHQHPDDRTIRNTRYVIENGPVCPANVLTQSGYSYVYDGIYEIIYDPLGILDPTYFCYIDG